MYSSKIAFAVSEHQAQLRGRLSQKNEHDRRTQDPASVFTGKNKNCFDDGSYLAEKNAYKRGVGNVAQLVEALSQQERNKVRTQGW